MVRTLLLLGALLAAAALEMPSCEDDTSAHCLGEDADMSPEGIDACLAGLGDKKSARCTAYGALMAACAEDTARGAVCGQAHAEGEGVPCLLQRVKPEQLTEACQAALPHEDLKGLAKFWKEGKRQLSIDEISELNVDDKDTYNRWTKKKKGRKTEKDKDRDYAVRKAKRERVTELLTTSVAEHVQGAATKPSVEACVKFAKGKADAHIAEDMTKTLTPFAKSELTGMCKTALNGAQKSEL